MPSVIFVSVFMSVVSCNTAAEKERVLDAVKRYNGALRRAYMEANLNLMKSVATMNEISRLFPAIQALIGGGDSMIAEQESFTVKKITVKKEGAFVETEEEWRYLWIKARTGEISKPAKEESYKIRYRLLLENGRWKVDRLESLD